MHKYITIVLLLLTPVFLGLLLSCEDDDSDDAKTSTIVLDDGTVVTRIEEPITRDDGTQDVRITMITQHPNGTTETNVTYGSYSSGNSSYSPTNGYTPLTIVVDASTYASTNGSGYEYDGITFTNCAEFEAYLQLTNSIVLTNCVDSTTP